MEIIARSMSIYKQNLRLFTTQLAIPPFDRFFAPPAQQFLGRVKDLQHFWNGQYPSYASS